MSVEQVKYKLWLTRADAIASGGTLYQITGATETTGSAMLEQVQKLGVEMGNGLGKSLGRSRDNEQLADKSVQYAHDAQQHALNALEGAESQEARAIYDATQLLSDTARQTQGYGAVRKAIQEELIPLHNEFMTKLGEIALLAKQGDTAAEFGGDAVNMVAMSITDYQL
jgi:hypothetical protein